MVNTMMVIIILVIYQLPTRYASHFTYIIFILHKNPKKYIHFTMLQVRKAMHRKLRAEPEFKLKSIHIPGWTEPS